MAMTGNVNFEYDPLADVLYCSFGPPQEAIGEEVGDGIVVRRNPETNVPVGITIVNFSRRFTAQPPHTVSVSLDTPVHAGF
jgi:uncharacterized protein YuzE